MLQQKEGEMKHTLGEMKTHYRHKRLKYKRHMRDIEGTKKQLCELLQKTGEEISDTSVRLAECFNQLNEAKQEKIESEEKLLKSTKDLKNFWRYLCLWLNKMKDLQENY